MYITNNEYISMGKQYKHVESYKHRYAKITLSEWLQLTVDYGRSKGYFPYRYADLSWVPKPDCPNRGVFLEYPILYRYLADNSLEYFGVKPAWSELPDMDLMQAKGFSIACVLDVAIITSEGLLYGFEIEHRHATEQSKIKLLNDLSDTVKQLEIYELSADWVLEQVQRPKTLKMSRLVPKTI